MDKLSRRMLLSVLQRRQRIFSRTFYTKDTGVPRDLMAMIQQEIDLSHGYFVLQRKQTKLQELKNEQKHDSTSPDPLGVDLSAAHFIAKLGGSVKFTGHDRWYRRGKDNRINLPSKKLPGLHLEMVDASRTELIYEGIDHFASLKHLRFLSLRQCPRIDDWCLARFHILPESLEVLDLSSCPQVTERGLATLHHLQNLKLLSISALPQVDNLELVAILVEEMLPNCRVIGVDYSDFENKGQNELKDIYDESASADVNIHEQPFQKLTLR